MKKKSILVVSDTEFAHGSVFDRGVGLAQQLDAGLHVVHPIPPDHPLSFGDEARFRQLMAMRGRAERNGVPVHLALRQGPAAEVVAEYGTARSVDLVVVGADPRRGWQRLGAAALAERVVGLTQQPTLVLPVRRAGDLGRFDRVLLAVDRIDRAGALLALAADVLGQPARHVLVLHAVDSLEPHAAATRRRWLVPEFRHHLLADARRNLEAAVRPWRHLVADTRVHATAGGALQAIEKHATEFGADLVVVGGSTRWLRAASVTSRLVRRAERPVLVLPETAVTTSQWRHLMATGRVA